MATLLPWQVPPPPTINEPKLIDRSQYDKLTKEQQDAYWQQFSDDAAVQVEKYRLGIEELPQKPVISIPTNPTYAPKHDVPVIRSSNPNVLSATQQHNAIHGTNFTFDELSDVRGRQAEAMGRDYDWGSQS